MGGAERYAPSWGGANAFMASWVVMATDVVRSKTSPEAAPAISADAMTCSLLAAVIERKSYLPNVRYMASSLEPACSILPGRAVRRLIAIECDDARQSALTLERPLKECFRRSDIPLRAQQKIDRLSIAVDDAIKLGPAAFDLHVSFIDAPCPASFACEPVLTLFDLGDVALDPTHDRRVR